MRYLELLVTDVAGITRADPGIRTEWIHRDHIETIEPYLNPDTGRDPMLRLQLTLTSGRTRYIPLRPVHPHDVDDVAREAVRTFLDDGTHPVHGAEFGDVDDDLDRATPSTS